MAGRLPAQTSSLILTTASAAANHTAHLTHAYLCIRISSRSLQDLRSTAMFKLILLPPFARRLSVFLSVCLLATSRKTIIDPTISELFAAADQSLFERVLSNKSRVLQPLLPEKKMISNRNLRLCQHDRQLIRKSAHIKDSLSECCSKTLINSHTL